MNFSEYQNTIANMPLYDDIILGLVGEVGEVTEHIKKSRRPEPYAKPINLDEFIHELGDVLWYLARLAEDYGISLDEVAKKNITKLNKRHGL